MGWFSKPSHVALVALGALLAGVLVVEAAPMLAMAFVVGGIGAFVGMGAAWLWGKLSGRPTSSETIAAAGVVGGFIGFLGGLMAGAFATGPGAYTLTTAGRVFEPVPWAFAPAKAALVGAGAMGGFLGATDAPFEPDPPAADPSGEPGRPSRTRGLVGGLR